MTLKEAKQLRDEIRADDLHCIVPLGFKPDRYFARIFGAAGSTTEFHSRAEWLGFKKQARSPIEMMIDKACGLIP